MDKIMAINSTVNGIVWGIPMLILIVGTGIYMTVKLNFFQFRHFGYAMKNTIGKVLDKSQKVEAQKGAITPMQAVTTALAATVGTGNIVGGVLDGNFRSLGHGNQVLRGHPRHQVS